jgi:hypothetical protein
VNAHVLDCATIRLRFSWIEIVTFCLLVVHSNSLVLIDRGLDINDPVEQTRGVHFLKKVAHMLGLSKETAI